MGRRYVETWKWMRAELPVAPFATVIPGLKDARDHAYWRVVPMTSV
jgi:hypothetical protein